MKELKIHKGCGRWMGMNKWNLTEQCSKLIKSVDMFFICTVMRAQHYSVLTVYGDLDISGFHLLSILKLCPMKSH